jgi:hypothetical protein
MRYRMTIEFDLNGPQENENPDKLLLHMLLGGRTLEESAALSIDNGAQIHVVKNRNGRCGKFTSAQHGIPFDIVELTDGEAS